MDVVDFRLEREELGVGTLPVINIFVNGEQLQDLVRSVERPYAEKEGNPALAGSYAGLAAGRHGDAIPASHYLSEPDETWFGDGDTVLLGCVCGVPGCWPLTARVEVSDTTVTWRDFRTGHRSWDLGTFGPFTFDRDAYESALATVCPR